MRKIKYIEGSWPTMHDEVCDDFDVDNVLWSKGQREDREDDEVNLCVKECTNKQTT